MLSYIREGAHGGTRFKMTNDKKNEYLDDSEWTSGKFKDAFFLDLTRAEGEIKKIDDNGVARNNIHYKKYYRQAKSKMYRIPLTKQNPNSEQTGTVFVIDFKDLSSRVQCEFLDYCRLYSKSNVTLLLKEIVMRLFENLDYNYAHMSIMKKLRVKISEI